jgi:hypothetical protein
MAQSSEHLDTDSNRERDANTYQVVYLIRRSGYEFVLSVPTVRAAYLSGAQARFQVRFRDPHQRQECVLDRKALEDFYESLCRLMEYVSIERQRHPRKH